MRGGGISEGVRGEGAVRDMRQGVSASCNSLDLVNNSSLLRVDS